MSFEPREYLRHILTEADFLVELCGTLSQDQFASDQTIRRAVVRSLEVIGEATKRLPADFRSAHPEVEWRAMAGMRDQLIHGYLAVDYDLVWDVVQTKIPVLQNEISRLL